MRTENLKWTDKKRGFTIVELIVVIVVIAILAAITLVSYASIRNKAYDAAVTEDLRNIGQKLTVYKSFEGKWPTTEAELESMDLSVSKNSYGNHFRASNQDWNILFCRAADGQGDMALVASSRGGGVFQYTKSGVSDYDGRWSTVTSFRNVCDDVGVSLPSSTTNREWFYIDGWKSWVH